jgi:hydroxyacylglutathione hydrolase
MSKLDIRQIPVLSDNYIYLVRCRVTNACAVIDPAEAEPVLEEARRLGWTITHVLNTHHHFDHTGGNEAIKAATGARILGFGPDAERLPGLDHPLADGDTVPIGEARAEVIATPGHTSGHVLRRHPVLRGMRAPLRGHGQPNVGFPRPSARPARGHHGLLRP